MNTNSEFDREIDFFYFHLGIIYQEVYVWNIYLLYITKDNDTYYLFDNQTLSTNHAYINNKVYSIEDAWNKIITSMTDTINTSSSDINQFEFNINILSDITIDTTSNLIFPSLSIFNNNISVSLHINCIQSLSPCFINRCFFNYWMKIRLSKH